MCQLIKKCEDRRNVRKKGPCFRSARSATLRPGACHHLPCFSILLPPHTMLRGAVIQPSGPRTARSSADPRSAVSVDGAESGLPGVGWSWVASAVCRLPLAALWKQHGSLRNVSWLSSCYSRVYNPWRSPPKAPENYSQLTVFNQRRLL